MMTMIRISRMMTSCAALFWTAAACAPATAAPVHASLLPESTVVFLHTPNMQQLQDKLHRTQFGRIFADKSMEGFAAQWQSFVNRKLQAYVETSGLTAQEVLQVARKGASLAILPGEQGNAEYVVFADVDDRNEEAQRLLAEAGRRLQAAGKARALRAGSAEFIVYQAGGKGSDVCEAAFAVHDGTLCISTSAAAMADILAPWGSRNNSLAGRKAFQQVMADCAREPGDGPPDGSAFVDPIGYLRVLNSQPQARLDKRNPVEFLTKHGLDAIRGIGGILNLGTKATDMTLRLSIFAPHPHHGAMGMFQMPSSDCFSPPDWLTNDVNMFGSVHLDLLAVLDHFGPLFDDVVGDGIEGTFDDILRDLNAEDGPHVDVRNDLIAHLGPRVMLLNDRASPEYPQSERSLIAIEAKDTAAVALAVKKLLRDDPGVRRIRLASADHDLWRIGEDMGVPGDDREARRLSSSAAMVANGHLLLATDALLIRKLVAAGRTDSDQLSDANDLALLDECLQQYSPGAGVGRIYSRTAADLHGTYEFLRSGLSNPSGSIPGMLAGTLLAAFRDQETGEWNIDFTSLPPYERISHKLGRIGIAGRNGDHGWYVVVVAIAPTAP